MTIVLIVYQIMSFVTKNLCNLSKVIRQCRSHMWHLRLKYYHLQLKQPIIIMQIPCNVYTYLFINVSMWSSFMSSKVNMLTRFLIWICNLKWFLILQAHSFCFFQHFQGCSLTFTSKLLFWLCYVCYMMAIQNVTWNDICIDTRDHYIYILV